MRQFLKHVLAYLLRLLQPEAKNPSIILLGDSLVELGNWEQLLNRADFINRGIGGDTLSHIQKRMKSLGAIRARIIFIEGGINDFPQSEPDSLFGKYQEIIAFWQSKQITPVVVGLVYISPLAAKTYPFRSDWRGINNQVSTLNENLKSFCNAQKIDFIDLNSLLSDSIQLRSEYTTDGVHLTEAAYHIWAGEILRFLNQYQL
ncbi:GDSL-type esterase/lipase family protein [Spirosoma arboris]|nr:GDSL-type esterase/lipase family protein [Spirosoma arboris]